MLGTNEGRGGSPRGIEDPEESRSGVEAPRAEIDEGQCGQATRRGGDETGDKTGRQGDKTGRQQGNQAGDREGR